MLAEVRNQQAGWQPLIHIGPEWVICTQAVQEFEVAVTPVGLQAKMASKQPHPSTLGQFLFFKPQDLGATSPTVFSLVLFF